MSTRPVWGAEPRDAGQYVDGSRPVDGRGTWFKRLHEERTMFHGQWAHVRQLTLRNRIRGMLVGNFVMAVAGSTSRTCTLSLGRPGLAFKSLSTHQLHHATPRDAEDFTVSRPTTLVGVFRWADPDGLNDERQDVWQSFHQSVVLCLKTQPASQELSCDGQVCVGSSCGNIESSVGGQRQIVRGSL